MTDSIVQHIFNNTQIIQRSTEGYVDATAMCKVHGKRISDYLAIGPTKAFLAEFSTNSNIPISALVLITKGGNDKHAQGTWIHPKLVPHLIYWLTQPKTLQAEKQVQLALWNKTGGKREVKTLAGSIDILTSTELIEVKHINSWINAVGQVIIYGSYYPSHKKRLHLFGETQESMLAFIQVHCYKLNIAVTWEA